MQPVTQILRVAHGSKLYGTSTPLSDEDYKGVHLPSGQAILLQRAENVIDTSVVVKDDAGKNKAESVDNQSFSVQNFFAMLSKGDTVATEILFAPPLQSSPLYWPEVQATGKLLLNRQCKGFVGYCVRQAAKYGIKGSRMAAVRDVLDKLATLRLGRVNTAKLSSIEAELHDWSAGREHVLWENIPSPNGTDLWHLNVCDRKMPMTVTIDEAYKVWSKVWENYGERARSAMNNEGIDWKAVSHAVRVARQAIELLTTGELTFPRPDATELLEIKLSQRPYSEVSTMLEGLVAQVQETSERSILPERSNHKAADALVARLYKEQVDG